MGAAASTLAVATNRRRVSAGKSETSSPDTTPRSVNPAADSLDDRMDMAGLHGDLLGSMSRAAEVEAEVHLTVKCGSGAVVELDVRPTIYVKTLRVRVSP